MDSSAKSPPGGVPRQSPIYLAAKRAFDFLGGLFLLALTTPIMLVIGYLIKRDSPGPALFRQIRLTDGGRPFIFYKFRTMLVNAYELYPELYYNFQGLDASQIVFKRENDPRVTRLGAILRRTSLDELPNFLNVVLGNMSLVGPRPEVPEMLQYYKDAGALKLSVKSGVTGLAAIRGRGKLNLEDTIKYDIEYVRRASFWLDLRILIETAWATLVGRGAY